MERQHLKVTPMTIWRWRHSRHIPNWVADVLTGKLQKRVEQAHEAQDDLRRYRAEPPKPLRALSGCCVGFYRRSKDEC
jgi:hypothetical protein